MAHKSTSTSHGSHALHEQPHSTGSTTWSRVFLFWTTAQPNLAFKWCWTLIRVVWAWTSVRTSPEAKYPLAQLPDTKPGFGKRSRTEQGWFHLFLVLLAPENDDVLGWPWVWAVLVNPVSFGVWESLPLSLAKIWVSATFRVSLDPTTTRAERAPRTQLSGDLPFPAF